MRSAAIDAPGWRLAWAGGVLAALLAGAGMAFLRWTLQVRTVPERIMEGSLLFLPPEVFGATIQRFGFDAKRYALYGASIAMLAVLAALGAWALQRRWSAGWIVALALGLWLFTMTVLMPLTDAGFFAIDLVDGTKTAVAAHFAVALTYAAALVAMQVRFGLLGGLTWKGSPPVSQRRTPSAAEPLTRRAALALAGSAVMAYGATLLLNALGPSRRYPAARAIDPQVPLPSGGLDPPEPHPYPVLTPAPGTRQLIRDKDGAVLTAGRQRGELATQMTTNNDFYVVTKNAVADPALATDQWRLVVDGEVEQHIEFSYDTIRRLPGVELTKTLECISNFVTKCELAPFGCDLISTARWKGVRVADVLGVAGLKPGVVSLATICADEFITALPIEAALDPDTLLVYEMNGETLPREHGYPLRLLIPGRYGMKNAKWVVALRPLRRQFADWYGQRNWSREGIVRTMTRIDVPAAGAVLPPGEQDVAGIAYAGDRGISKVEFSTDGGATWLVAAFLEPAPGRDAWVRWRGRFTLQPGASITITARATDGTGELQIEPFTLPEPDGGTGWHTTDIRARLF